MTIDKRNNQVVVTINIGQVYKKMANLTIPHMREYAEKIGADFCEIKEATLTEKANNYSAYWAKFQILDLFHNYERILLLDLDVIVRPHCPNLFDIVPESKLGVLFETDYERDFSEEIAAQNSRMASIEWKNNEYFNVGVMVVSRCHKSAFTIEDGDDGGSSYPEQSLLNYKVQKLGIETFHLDYKFNHMHYLNLDNNNRDLSNIIHYAAIVQELRELIIAEDIHRFKNNQKPLEEALLHQINHEMTHLAYHFQTDESLNINDATCSISEE